MHVRPSRYFWMLLSFLAAAQSSEAQGTAVPSQRSVAVWGESHLSTNPDIMIGGKLEDEDAYSFGRIANIAVDDSDRVYVLDGLFSRVQVYDEGRYWRTIGSEGWGPGEFQRPVSIAVLADYQVVVGDAGKQLYAIFDADGAYEGSRSIKGFGFLREPLVSGESGRFYAAWRNVRDTSIERYLEGVDVRDAAVTRERRPLPHYYRPMIGVSGEARGYTGYLYQPFTADLAWTILPNGWLVTAIGDQYDLTISDRSGRRIGSIGRDVQAMPVGSVEAALAHDSATALIERYAKTAQASSERFKRKLKIPLMHPPVLGLVSDRLGRIWVQVPSGERPNILATFDVFERTGRFLGTIDVQGGEDVDPRTLAIGVRYLYGVGVSSEDVPYVQRFRLPRRATR